MSLLEINPQPSGTETHHDFSVRLDGQLCRLSVYTNGAGQRWFLDFAGEGGTVRGIALSAGVDLLAPYRHLGVPPGYLFVSGDEDPDLEAFRERRVRLLYLEAP
jgi:hypothetical protein